MHKIPFCRTEFGPEEKKAVLDVMESGWVVMGQKTKEFEEEFAKYVGAKHAIFVDSCTSALDLSVKCLLKKKVWDKKLRVEVPSMTFTASAEVIVNNGMNPEFADVKKDTFCSSNVMRQAILVHLTGNKAKQINNTNPIIEDSAHRIERDQCKDNQNLVCFSFYATKNMTTVQGGMIATNNDEFATWLRKARDHGVSKGTTERYKEGSWKYTVDFVGWREKSDDMHAAIGLAQLAKLDSFNEARNRIITRYNERLGLKRTGLHLYPILVDNRDDFIKFMGDAGIQTSVHFLPLHKMPAYKKWSKVSLPNTEYLGERLVSLPLYPSLTDEQVDYIADKVLESKLLIHG